LIDYSPKPIPRNVTLSLMLWGWQSTRFFVQLVSSYRKDRKLWRFCNLCALWLWVVQSWYSACVSRVA